MPRMVTVKSGFDFTKLLQPDKSLERRRGKCSAKLKLQSVRRSAQSLSCMDREAAPESLSRGGDANLLHDQVRVLSFRRPGLGIATRPHVYLAYGLIVTWIVGVGRYWDHPNAAWWQYAGFGSVAYVFVLAALLWGIGWPLRPARWTFRNVLLFVCLTSLPALLYAIPVERLMTLDRAQATNFGFLAVVASWRVALVVWFLRRMAQLEAPSVFAICGILLSGIVWALSALNLEHAVFEIMGGNDRASTAGDAAYGIVIVLTGISWLVLPVALVTYGYQVVLCRRDQPRGDAT